MESTETEDINEFLYDLSDYDSNQFFGTNFDPAPPILEINSLPENSDSEGYGSGKQFVSYFVRSMPMIRLTENHQRPFESGKTFRRFVDYFSPDQFQYGTHIVTKCIDERMKRWSYVPLYEFSEGVCETRVLKRDIYDRDKIMPGSTETVDTLPLYFVPLLKMASGDLLSFSDFAESVDYCLMPMTDTMKEVMEEDGSFFSDLGRSAPFAESEEIHECVKNLGSLNWQLQNCQNDMIIEFKYFFQAKNSLRSLSGELDDPNTRLSSDAVIKLCRLRDFCNYALTLYLNSVLKTMEVLESLSSISNKLLSFVHPRLLL